MKQQQQQQLETTETTETTEKKQEKRTMQPVLTATVTQARFVCSTAGTRRPTCTTALAPPADGDGPRGGFHCPAVPAIIFARPVRAKSAPRT
jgi:hypothetical protein